MLADILLVAAFAQTPGEADGRIAEFQSAVDEKRYDAAEKLVAPLVADYDAATLPADRRPIVEQFDRTLKNPRCPAKLQQTILKRFGGKPDDGEKLVVKALKLRHVDEVPESVAAALAALGSRRDSKYVDTFDDYVDDGRVEVVKAAAAAMGEYFGEKEALRKKIVGILVLAYESAGSGRSGQGATTAAPRSLVDHEFRMLVRHDFQLALARLTGGVQFDRAEDWSNWYRDAKSAKWCDGIDKPAIKLDGLQPGPGGH